MKNTSNVNRSGRQVKCPVCGTVFGIRADGMCLLHSVAFKRWQAENPGGTIAQFNAYREGIAIVAITSK